jgi:hypothetical protein
MVTDAVVVEQAKGFLRAILDISIAEASDLLRSVTPRPTMTN